MGEEADRVRDRAQYAQGRVRTRTHGTCRCKIKGRSRCKPEEGVPLRVEELRDPLNMKGSPIQRRWLYVFRQGSAMSLDSTTKLSHEFWIPKSGRWMCAPEPGIGCSRRDFETYGVKRGVYLAPKRSGIYFFMLSPVQLPPKHVDRLCSHLYADQDPNIHHPASSSPAVVPDPNWTIAPTPVQISRLNRYKRYTVRVADPLRAAENIHRRHLQPALHRYYTNRLDEERISRVTLAALLNGILQRSEIREHLEDHLSSADAAKQLLEGDKKVKKSLKKEVAAHVEQLRTWMSLTAYKAVEHACLESGSDGTALLIVHKAKITFRLNETQNGRELQKEIYLSEESPFVRKLISNPETYVKPVKKVSLSALRMLSNMANAIEVVEGEHFESLARTFLRRSFRVKYEWKNTPERVNRVKLWGRTIKVSHLPSDVKLEVHPRSKLADYKRLYEKFDLDVWFTGAGVGFKSLSAVLSVDRALRRSGNLNEEEKLSLILTLVDVAYGLEEFGARFTAKRLTRTSSFANATDSAIDLKYGRIGAGIGAVVSLISVHTSTEEAGKAHAAHEYIARDFYILAAVSHAVAFGAAVWSLFFNLLTRAAMGPGGWVALVFELLAMLFKAIAESRQYDNLEKAVRYSYFGVGFVSDQDRLGTGYRVMGHELEDVRGKPQVQLDNLCRVLGAFKVVSADATGAKTGILDIYPGLVTPQSVFRVRWHYNYRNVPSAAVLHADLFVSSWTMDVRRTFRLKRLQTELYLDVYAKAHFSNKSEGKIDHFSLIPTLSGYPGGETCVRCQLDLFGDGSVIVPSSDQSFDVPLGSGKAKEFSRWAGYREDRSTGGSHTVVVGM